MKYCSLISRTWQTIFTNFSSLKLCPIVQVLANIIAIILLPSIYCIVKKLSQKRFFGIQDEKIIKLLSLSLKGADLFSGQRFQFHLHSNHL